MRCGIKAKEETISTIVLSNPSFVPLCGMTAAAASEKRVCVCACVCVCVFLFLFTMASLINSLSILSPAATLLHLLDS